MARGQSPYQGRYTVPIADFSPIAQGGRDFAAGLQSALGDWGKFKGELNELEASIGGKLEANPELMKSLQEDEDHRKTIENLQKGKVNLKELRALSGTIAGRTAEQDRMIRQQMLGLTRDRAVRENELEVANFENRKLIQNLAGENAKYMSDRLKNLQTAEEKHDLINKEAAAKAAQYGLTEDQAKVYRKTMEAEVRYTGAKADAAEWGVMQQRESVKAAEQARNIKDAVIDQYGGLDQYADSMMQMETLQREAVQSQNAYRDLMGAAQAMTALGKTNPTLKAQLDPISSVIKTLQTTKVIETKVGGKPVRVSLEEYQKLNAQDPTLHPWTGMAAELAGSVANQSRAMQVLLSASTVQAITPEMGATDDDTSGSPPMAGGQDFGKMTVSEAKVEIPKRIAALQARKAALEKETQELKGGTVTTRKMLAREIQPITMGGFGAGSIPEVEVPVDMDWVRDRSGQIALEINGIEKEIIDLKELTFSTAPSTPTP